MSDTIIAANPPKMKITFYVDGEPRPQPRPRAFAKKFGDNWTARVYDAGTAEGWKSAVAVAAKACLPKSPIDGPVGVELHFFFSRPKAHHRTNGELKDSAPYWHTSSKGGDVDNLFKAVTDALTQLRMWHDDGQIASTTITKSYQERPGCEITIETLEHHTPERNGMTMERWREVTGIPKPSDDPVAEMADWHDV